MGAGAGIAGAAAITVVGFGDRHGNHEESGPQQQENFAEFGALVVPAKQDPIVVVPTVATRPIVEPTPYDGAIGRMKIQVNDAGRVINVDAVVESIGQTNNRLDVPEDAHKVGWYNQFGESAKPGHKGNAVFTAHVDKWPNTLGAFHDISKMKNGDVITVTMDNGLEYKYTVDVVTRYSEKDIPTGELIWADQRPKDEEWITLITCGGRFVPSRPGGPGEYLDRDIVIAKRKIG